MDRYSINLESHIFIRIEPILKQWFGIDRNNINFDIFESCWQEDPYQKCGEPSVENIKFINVPIPIERYDPNLINKFCSRYGIKTGSDIHCVLFFLYIYHLRKYVDYCTPSEEASSDYYDYIYDVRPNMLKLYIALHSEDKNFVKNGVSHHFLGGTKISFGSNPSVKIETWIPWFQLMLNKYLDKYLGVSSVAEAQRELNTVYGKKVGAKMNVKAVQYMWGMYHLFKSCSMFTPTKAIYATVKQSKIIADLLISMGILDYVEHEDGIIVRSTINYYIKKGLTIEEILDERTYKTSPNNIYGTGYF